jgi:heme a synthase
LNNKIFFRIGIAACLLAFVVIVLGAYVRLSDAGLGCPDWPGCYGQITAPDDLEEISRARLSHPEAEIDSAKAWKEMIHRYFASALGLLILFLAYFAWKHRSNEKQQTRLPYALVVLVIFQGLLGMWTVTELVKPTIVTLHLLMGLTTLSLLCWLMLKHAQPWYQRLNKLPTPQFLRNWARLALVALVLQIFLGGWTSTNYVALHCPDFPTCQGEWWPQTNFSEAFVFFKESGVNYEGGSLSLEAGTTVHLMHRVGALISTIIIAGLAIIMLLKSTDAIIKKTSLAILGILSLQVALGISNVLLQLPIPVAVAHNAVATLLLLSLVLLNYLTNESKNELVGQPT